MRSISVVIWQNEPAGMLGLLLYYVKVGHLSALLLQTENLGTG